MKHQRKSRNRERLLQKLKAKLIYNSTLRLDGMRCLPLLIVGIVIFSGCLDFLDEEDVNGAPQASANSEGGSNFEPNQEIVFTGKGSSDPDGDVLEYFWDFDKNDGKDESIIGNIANNGRITHSYEDEGVYTVTLTVTDGNEFSSATTKVTIQEATSEVRAIVTTDEETAVSYTHLTLPTKA